MEKIGEGTYSKIYRHNGQIIAITDNKDQSKLAMSMLSGKHIPMITKLESLGNYTKFSMPEYHKLTGFNVEIAAYLIAAWKNYSNKNPVDTDNIPAFYDRCIDFLAYVEGRIDHSLLCDMRIILDAMPETRINFDLHSDNFMQDDSGTIILLDIVWDISDSLGEK